MIVDDGVERFTEMFGLMLSYYMIYSSNIMKVLYKYHTDYVDKVISIENGVLINTTYVPLANNNHKLSLVLALVCSMNSDEKSLQGIYLKIAGINVAGNVKNIEDPNYDYSAKINDLLISSP